MDGFAFQAAPARGLLLPKYKAGQRINHAHMFGGTATTAAQTLNILVGTPFGVSAPTTISGLDLEFTSTTAGNMRVGIGRLDGDGSGWAMTLLADAGAQAVAAVANTLVSWTQAFTFQPNAIYLLLTLPDTTMTTRAIINSTDLFGNNTSAGALTARTALVVAQAYGALPTTKTFTGTSASAVMLHGVVA